jgi:hypothetical protein
MIHSSSQQPIIGTKSLFFILGMLTGAIALSGCASSPKENTAIHQMLKTEIGPIDEDLAARMMNEKVPYKINKKSAARLKVEGQINQRVWWWINYYTTRDRDRYERILERGEYYRPLIQQVLAEHQLPPELYYLAMIESGYVTHARSHCAAVGIWQFMRPTALHYGLGVSGQLDERQHPVSATHAAARYLKDLHRQFDSWYLAIAAYNAGQGRINKAIKRAKTRDFWELAFRGYLPEETMDYIPKFLATATIAGHLAEFGFQPIQTKREIPEWPKLTQVKLKPGTQVSKIAEKAQLSEEDLLRLNPQLKLALKKSSKISRKKQVRVWVPRSSADEFNPVILPPVEKVAPKRKIKTSRTKVRSADVNRQRYPTT